MQQKIGPGQSFSSSGSSKYNNVIKDIMKLNIHLNKEVSIQHHTVKVIRNSFKRKTIQLQILTSIYLFIFEISKFSLCEIVVTQVVQMTSFIVI